MRLRGMWAIRFRHATRLLAHWTLSWQRCGWQEAEERPLRHALRLHHYAIHRRRVAARDISGVLPPIFVMRLKRLLLVPQLLPAEAGRPVTLRVPTAEIMMAMARLITPPTPAVTALPTRVKNITQPEAAGARQSAVRLQRQMSAHRVLREIRRVVLVGAISAHPLPGVQARIKIIASDGLAVPNTAISKTVRGRT